MTMISDGDLAAYESYVFNRLRQLGFSEIEILRMSEKDRKTWTRAILSKDFDIDFE